MPLCVRSPDIARISQGRSARSLCWSATASLRVGEVELVLAPCIPPPHATLKKLDIQRNNNNGTGMQMLICREIVQIAGMTNEKRRTIRRSTRTGRCDLGLRAPLPVSRWAVSNGDGKKR